MKGTSRFFTTILIFISLMTFIRSVSPAKVILIPDDYASLSEAVDVAEDNDTIQIRPGIHSGDDTIIDGKSLTIIGLGATPEEVVLKGWGMFEGYALLAKDSSMFVISNLSIKGRIGYEANPPHQCAGGTGGPGGPALRIESVENIVLSDLHLEGGRGGNGLDNDGGCPAGGTGGPGGSALWLDSISDAELGDLTLIGGNGGFGYSFSGNEYYDPIPGVDGLGGVGLKVEGVEKLFLSNSLAAGGCGEGDGDSITLNNRSTVQAFEVKLEGSCGTGEVKILDDYSTYNATFLMEATSWALY